MVHFGHTIIVKAHPSRLVIMHLNYTITVKSYHSCLARHPCSYYVLIPASTILHFPSFGDLYMIRVATTSILILHIPFADLRL